MTWKDLRKSAQSADKSPLFPILFNMFQEAWIPAIKNGVYTNFQLFDLENDPAQKSNIARENPELLETLKKKLLKINASVMADGPDWQQDKAPRCKPVG